MLKQRDAVGLLLYHHQTEAYVPPRSVQSHLQVLLKTIDQARPRSETHMAPAFHDLAERIRRRASSSCSPDLLDEPDQVLEGLRHFRHLQHEVIVFHLLDPRERDLAFRDQTPLLRPREPDQTLTTQPWHIQHEYRALMDELIQTYRLGCAEAGIDYALLDTATPFDVALSRYLAQRKKMG